MAARATTRLRQLLAGGPLIVPSVYDCITARLAEAEGFPALHMAGSAVEASLLGGPDLGLLTMTELVEHAARVTSATSSPILVDIDSGFGGVLPIQRTIREMERAGVAGVHIEDQAIPKTCPFLDGRKVLGRTQAVDHVKAALDARSDPDFLVIARSDADAISLDEAVERCNLFLAAGADLAFPIFLNCNGRSWYALSAEEQEGVLRSLPQRIEGPVMYMGAPPPAHMTLHDIAEAGWSVVLDATACFSAAANAVAAALADLRANGSRRASTAASPGRYHDGLEFMRLFHLDRYVEIESRFTSRDPKAPER